MERKRRKFFKLKESLINVLEDGTEEAFEAVAEAEEEIAITAPYIVPTAIRIITLKSFAGPSRMKPTMPKMMKKQRR